MVVQRRVGTRTRLTASIDRFSGGSTRAHEPLLQNPTLDKHQQFAKNTRSLLGGDLARKGAMAPYRALIRKNRSLAIVSLWSGAVFL
jgi:hypothetical protein